MSFSNSPSIKILNRFENKRNRLKRNSQIHNSPNLNTSATPLRKKIKVEYENRFNQYEYSLNLYTIPPFGQIELEEAQKSVEERLKILRVFDDTRKDQVNSKIEFNFTDVLNTRFKALGDVFINEVSGGKENTKAQAARRRDHISHFLLRLLCCHEESMRKWFIQREIDLLKYRLDAEKNTIDLVNLLTYNNLNYQEVDSKEKKILIKQNKINFNNSKTTSSNVFYKIPFEEALELVKYRKAFLQNGFCYCSINEMFSIIASKFKLELSRSLANLLNYLPYLNEENRLLPIFKTIYTNIIEAKKLTKIENQNGMEQISPDMIDELSVTSFPPCMRNTHELLRMNHHLKHYGRLHYGLFLKGIGLKLDDALEFFREEFIQNMTPDKFAKQYAYNIQYNYGKVGKKVNLSGFKCAKIQNENAPGAGDSHGCPFKHFDSNHLSKMLKKHSIDDESAKEMIDLVGQFKYTLACTNYFACKNKGIRPPQEIYHPNQYFRESRKVAKGVYVIDQKVNEENGDKNVNNGVEENGDKNVNNDVEVENDNKDVNNAVEENGVKNSDENNSDKVQTNSQVNENIDLAFLQDIDFDDSI